MSNAAVPNFFTIVSEYVDHMLPADNTMKVLLVDEATLNVMSMACSQTLLLKKGVFLVCRVDEHRQRKVMKGMRCIVFIRPQMSSVEAVAEELRAAKYESYAIHFSNAASPELLDCLARADVDSLVTRVSEVFCDFEAHNADAFVSVVSPRALLPAFLSAAAVQRVAEGIAATFLALRRRPHVRFHQNNAFARRVALELGDILSKNAELYNYKNKDSLLLILDRSSDVLTPLLTPWTYQAMLHEYIGMQHNRLQFSDATVNEEYVFSQQDDPFFAANMFANWGDLCNNVKTYVDKCKSTLNIDRSTATMDEIKEFMQRLPQTKSLTGSVTKHATVVSHLSSIIKQRGILDVSLLEQDMVASSNASDHWNRLQSFAAKRHSGGVETTDLFRLCLIYHLRYEKPGQNSRVSTLLEEIDPHKASCLRKLDQYSGERSTDELFGATGVMASIVKTFVDVGNIYTQHEPVLKRTLLQLFSGRLPIDQYPYLTPPPTSAANSSQTQQQLSFRPKEVAAFICGGFTYEEAALVNAINAGTAFTGSVANNLHQGGVRASIGGTAVLNSEMFLNMLSTHP
ncbi:putative vacuolar protein sorting-associated protein [Trypanosoma cruzi]|uniref:Putative sec1-like protein n=1 Tax=Trypanosoma cruzi TaxID=5693 RepID=A0A2V2UVA1_TRYCR|nr:vacuolar protein sorting-associated protein [Trypanosoma cruzi cruzi]PWU88010.1 putative sec1-like protein [Trypanosoma cruzi]RNF17880.1 putative vacuolar protein sorting-associated protein [Trypanosoma cruzi]